MSQVSKTLSSLDDKQAIDAVKFLSDVGDTDLQILDRILWHCTVDQLMHIEKSSKGRDLTPITNKLWKNFYKKKFGTMQLERESVTWRQLYEEKVKEIEAKASATGKRMVQNYRKEKARKESRQIKFYEVSPSSTSRKRKVECNGTATITKSKLVAKKDTREEVQYCDVPKNAMIKKRTFELDPVKGRLMEKTKEQMRESIEMKNFIVFQRKRMQKY